MNRLASTVIRAVPPAWLEFVSHNQWRVPGLRRVLAWGASLVKSQDGLILHGLGKGLRFNVANSHSSFLLGNHEPEVQTALAAVLKPGMVYYDVGANVGFFAVIAAKMVGETGSVYCFEPLPANARQIEYNAKLNGMSGIVTRCEALGGSDRTETLTLSAEPTWGSLATVGKAPAKACGEMKVQVRMLDSLSREESLPLPDLMKIDVEGAEQELLCGARETLLAKRPLLVIELHSTNAAVTGVLDELNYDYAVLGSPVPVSDADWDANIIAVPRERPGMIDLMKQLSERAGVA